MSLLKKMYPYFGNDFLNFEKLDEPFLFDDYITLGHQMKFSDF